MLELLVYIGLVVWNCMGLFMFYTSIRDDIRNEKERKEKES
ncbi:hypothetical protein ACDH46_01525 [Aerococcaceae bacterium zg-1292]